MLHGSTRARFAFFILLVFWVTLVAGIAQAVEVRVFKPVEEGLAPNAMRQEVLYLGFQEAVFQESLKLLPGRLDEDRSALLREYLADKANDQVLGYRELAVSSKPDGVSMVLDVDVNRRTLRHLLEQVGLFHTITSPLAVVLQPGPGLTQEDLASLDRLRRFSGVLPSQVGMPQLRLDRLADNRVEGVLISQNGSWSAVDANLATVWFELWQRYFASGALTSVGADAEVLSVSGWFTPDGANEFDNVLRDWDSELRDVRLVDMDLATEGVSARWEVEVLNRQALVTRLEQYLPSRGLSYTLSRQGL